MVAVARAPVFILLRPFRLCLVTQEVLLFFHTRKTHLAASVVNTAGRPQNWLFIFKVFRFRPVLRNKLEMLQDVFMLVAMLAGVGRQACVGLNTLH